MTKNIYLFITILLLVSCGTTPETGVSSNPNFISGKVFYSDSKPIHNALVVASNVVDTVKSYTSQDGSYTLEVEESVKYQLDVVFNDETIIHLDEVSSQTESNLLLLKADHDSLYYATSIDSSPVTPIDTTQNDTTDTLFTGSGLIDTLSGFDSTELFDDSVSYALTSEVFDDAFIQHHRAVSNSDSNYNNNGDSEMLTIGHTTDSDANFRLLGKLNTLSQFIGGNYSKVTISFSVYSGNSFTDKDSIKVHKVLKTWDESTVSANDQNNTDSWEVVGIGVDDLDASRDFTFGEKISDIVDGEILTIDISELYKDWAAGDSNYGFLLTYSEVERSSVNAISLSSSESVFVPVVTFIK